MKITNNKLQLAWLAGLIDGEGSFGFYRYKYVHHHLRIVLQSRDKFVLEKVQKLAGGKLRHREKQKSWRPNCSDQWEWDLCKRADLMAFCIKIKPFLVLKKQDCANMLKSIRSLAI